ncbi:MAG TPA: FecR domain-containing protein [Polyangiaceae bacterium]|nr:FecR domain-containing protein [Polyangiaceae bacterium]
MQSKRPQPTEQQVTEAFRALANEHALEREPFDKRRAWHALQYAQRTLRVPVRSARVRWALALAVFALGIVVGAPAWQALTMLRYEAHGLSTEGSNLSARDTPADLAFSDGSRVTVSPHSTLSVDLLGKRAALTRLFDGRLHVAVRHESDTNYRFLVGPYEVQVVGTEFDLEWHAQGDGLTVVMQSGEVRILGDGNPRQVRAGQTLRLPSSREQQRAATVAAPPLNPPSLASLPVAAEQLPAASKEVRTAQKPSALVARSGEADWSALLNAGQFAAIMRDADARGGERLLESAPASDLKTLALAARYTGRRSLSLRAWQALRARFAADALNQGAAFFLGRGYEEQGDTSEAMRWLARYLAESPAGAYAGEALGRRLLLLSKSGQRAEAVSAARSYLERYPRGAYAKSAKLVIQPE